ncbi:MAG: DUF1610 domain-containing protein [Candidatus Aenigmarchaeota archaeon]|nr:DUF1610 domain-containing protein [Candidatus Aenigmarchaeota archaeon]
MQKDIPCLGSGDKENGGLSMKCTSCHETLISEDNFTKFKCPSCGKTTVVRCGRCRKKGIFYSCKSCGFEGP